MLQSSSIVADVNMTRLDLQPMAWNGGHAQKGFILRLVILHNGHVLQPGAPFTCRYEMSLKCLLLITPTILCWIELMICAVNKVRVWMINYIVSFM